MSLGPFALADGPLPACQQAAIYGLILPPGHKQAKFKIFRVGGIRRVICPRGCDDFCACIHKRPLHLPLVHSITTGEALHLHDQHAVPFAGLHIGEETLHLRAGRYAVAADDLLVYLAHGEV